jgi:sulfopyruvate decarboxylase TPP-binding subunit
MGDAEARDATLDAPAMDWQRAIADVLAARGVTVAAYVPDTRLQGILRALAGHQVRMRSLTREEKSVSAMPQDTGSRAGALSC